ncbi:S-adenosyl-L-methionine-dependent methyltransferase [Sesbania bispinosa]|nr:S-adenosyl-L-methionine-dependent methyltransferase [Sesbania bispinosa]
MNSDMEEKWIKHYSSNHKILLVGEGDFSFALCLAKAFGSASNMIATSLDSKEKLLRNYARASTNLNELENLGCTIVHEVNAGSMSKHPSLEMKVFDRIVFNFPHAGFDFREHDLSQIKLHQKVVSGFLKNARKMLRQDGEIHVTHKNAHPFCKWEIVKMAEEAGLLLVKKVPFFIWEYPGYVNKRGSGCNCDGSFPVGDCSTFKFSKASHLSPLHLQLEEGLPLFQSLTL